MENNSLLSGRVPDNNIILNLNFGLKSNFALCLNKIYQMNHISRKIVIFLFPSFCETFLIIDPNFLIFPLGIVILNFYKRLNISFNFKIVTPAFYSV